MGDDLNEFLQQVRGEYLDSLKDKLQQVDALLTKLESNPQNVADRDELFSILHRMSGTAGSFNLDEIGKVADAWERQIRAVQSDSATATTWSDMRPHLLKLRHLAGVHGP